MSTGDLDKLRGVLSCLRQRENYFCAYVERGSKENAATLENLHGKESSRLEKAEQYIAQKDGKGLFFAISSAQHLKL